MANNALSIIEDVTSILPSEQDLADISNDLSDIIAENPRKLFATLRIASAGANIFQVREPGAEEYTAIMPPMRCVIVASHPLNTRWEGGYDKHQPGERPACASTDGITGIDADGVVHRCNICPHNQFGVDGQRKVCGNRTQLYILREGDVLPTLFSLPPSAKNTFNNYRVYARMAAKYPLYALVTEMSLETKTSRSGIPYSTLILKAVGKLPQDAAAKVKRSVDSMVASAQQTGAIFDANADDGGVPVQTAPVDEATGMQIADVDLPDGF